MNHYVISSLLTFFLTAFLSLFVYYKNRNSLINKKYALFSLSMAVWSFCYFKMFTSPTREAGLFWSRALHFGAVFIPILFLHFVLVLLKKAQQKRKIIITGYVIAFVLLVICPTRLFILYAAPKFKFWHFIVPGILYHLFTAFFFVCVIYGLYELFVGFKSLQGLIKNQVKYVFVAYMIGYSGGATAFLPLFNIPTPSLGLYPIPICMLMITYAIVKYHLMDINFVVTRGVVYLVLLLLSSVVYLGFAVAFDRIFSGLPGYNSLASYFLTFLIIILPLLYFTPYIRIKTEKAVEQVLFGDKYLYRDSLRDFSRKITFSLSKKELLDNVVNFISEAIQVPYVSIVLKDEMYGYYTLSASTGFSDGETKSVEFREDSALIEWLRRNRSVLIREEMAKIVGLKESRYINKELDRINAYLCLPLCVSANFIGFLALSPRSSKEMYSHVDIGLLQAIANQISLVVAYKQLEKHVFQSEKLASLGTLAAGIAHEIKNPLLSIKTFAQLLPQKYNDENFRNEFGRVVSADTDRIAKLIDNILSLTKPRPSEMLFNKIGDIIEETLALLKNEILKSKVKIVKTYSASSSVHGNKEELKQVFLNIILNAIHAMPEGGVLKISSEFTSAVSAPGDSRTKRYYVRIKFEDTGKGIDEHYLNKLFDPFFTTKTQGTGLGLTLCHRIIEQHKGFIGVNSKKGEGTIFWIDLPI